MSKKIYRVLSLCILTALAVSGLTGCRSRAADKSSGQSEEQDTGSVNENKETEDLDGNTETAPVSRLSVDYDEEDIQDSWDEETAVTVSCSGTRITVDGTGAAAENGSVTISKAGTYVFSGSISDGRIIVDAGKEDTVRIILNDINVSCSNQAAINGIQSRKIIITAAEGTTNQISDGASYTYEEDSQDEPNAAIYTKDDLTVNGSGTLTVAGNYNHGIFSKDSLLIASGSLIVTSANDGLKGKDSVVVLDGSIHIEAGGDGIQSSNDSDTSKGYVVLMEGSYSIQAGMDGIQAETVLQIAGGDYDIITGGGSLNASAEAGWGAGGKDSGKDGDIPAGQSAGDNTAAVQEEASDSAKGLKAGTALFVDGGSFQIDSLEDSIHTNESAVITEGELVIRSGDDGVHADALLSVEGGTITITKSYEGLEGKAIEISGGIIHVTADDDGINAAGGQDGSFVSGRPGADRFSTSGEIYIRITGGYLYVDAGGDGIDSNGSLYVDRGTTLVNGPVNNGDGALDYDGTAVITGGVFIAAGSSGMASSFGEESVQNSVLYYFDSVMEAGTPVTLYDETGSMVLGFEPVKKYQSILISTPVLEQNKTYQICTGGSFVNEGEDGYYQDGAGLPGTLASEFILDSAAYQAAQSGEIPSGGRS